MQVFKTALLKLLPSYKQLSLCVFITLSIASCASDHSNNIPLSDNPSYSATLIFKHSGILWGIAELPNKDLLATEKSGKLLLIKPAQNHSGAHKNYQEITGLPDVFSKGQGGLMDVALDPGFIHNRLIYLSYSALSNDRKASNTAIMRAKLEGTALKAQQILYKAEPLERSSHHFGSRIAFNENGQMYFSIGDRGKRDSNPQNLQLDGGKIYRINTNGSIPSNNPFYQEETAKTATYSYGHRNPQGLAFDNINKQLWAIEHGPRGGDELNLIDAGGNYGWPVISYGKNYSGTELTALTAHENMMQPIYYWVPSIAPSSLALIKHSNDKHLRGNFLIGSLKFKYLEHLIMQQQTVIKRERLLSGIGRIRDVIETNSGTIYISVEGKGLFQLQQR